VPHGLRLQAANSSALGRVTPDKRVRLVRGDREAFGPARPLRRAACRARPAARPRGRIVSLGGRAGTGKSALALCAGLEAVLERQAHRRCWCSGRCSPSAGQELGYLPGSESEKMQPWAQAVFDVLGALVSQDVIDEVLDRGMLEVLPLTHIRAARCTTRS
jgi:PhoH-like ATPase